MKKYETIGELLIDYRKHQKLTQVDLAAIFDVDVRTIIRWERNESLIDTKKEKFMIENLGIPHQVVRNLNTGHQVPVYFDFKRWRYALTLLSSMVKSSNEFKTNAEFKTNRIETLSADKDFDFINFIQKNQKNCNPLGMEIIKTASRILPELNLVIHEQSGYHAGHVSVLPLKYESYKKIRDKEMMENQLTKHDLSRDMNKELNVYYFYSIFSNSLDNTYYLINKMLFYFKRPEITNYIFAGITYQELEVDRFREAGFQVIWEHVIDENQKQKATFISGNFDTFLFGEENC